MLWWDKPLGARTLVRVFLKHKLIDAERKGKGVSYLFLCRCFYFDKQLQRRQSRRSKLVHDLKKIFEGNVTTIRDISRCQSEGNILVDWGNQNFPAHACTLQVRAYVLCVPRGSAHT